MEVYRGDKEVLCLSFDIGTTQCARFLLPSLRLRSITREFFCVTAAVSITHCIPELPPKVRVVTRWPSSPVRCSYKFKKKSQAHACPRQNSSKIPTVILYSPDSKAQAIGAETCDEAVLDRAEDNGWLATEHFKLWLHDKTMPAPSLPDEAIVVERRAPLRPESGAIEAQLLPFHVAFPPLFLEWRTLRPVSRR
jgi:hypothetical protein